VKPFDSDDDYELYEQVRSGNVDMKCEEIASGSEDAKDLILNIRDSAPDVKLDSLHSHLKIYNVKVKLKRATEAAKVAARLAKLGEA